MANKGAQERIDALKAHLERTRKPGAIKAVGARLWRDAVANAVIRLIEREKTLTVDGLLDELSSSDGANELTAHASCEAIARVYHAMQASSNEKGDGR